ncbi:UNKNOWN [Stylonychia lemnae]|uniref:Uncharacterized protein n=1 Tax=Stylonychia lemnae TaxID=5949 RepID=A0A077ZXH7_STYLE|nr:UNKNOWN [Stylonychia lemnae]|eukprot:CDW73251.1 UNKNOWN [Stylonychia lemnae]
MEGKVEQKQWEIISLTIQNVVLSVLNYALIFGILKDPFVFYQTPSNAITSTTRLRDQGKNVKQTQWSLLFQAVILIGISFVAVDRVNSFFGIILPTVYSFFIFLNYRQIGDSGKMVQTLKIINVYKIVMISLMTVLALVVLILGFIGSNTNIIEVIKVVLSVGGLRILLQLIGGYLPNYIALRHLDNLI